MKNSCIKWFFFIAVIGLVTFGCTKEEKVSKVEANGLTKEINELVPLKVLTEMKDLGMPIYTGENPPNIENSYLLSPLILLHSNISGDVIGNLYADCKLKFYQQDNDKLLIQIKYIENDVSGNGIGGYIVGNNNSFTVFSQMTITQSQKTAVTVEVISGNIGVGGLTNVHRAVFMVDDKGDPDGVWIENGEGRVSYDQDGFSEDILLKKATQKSAQSKSPINCLTSH